MAKRNQVTTELRISADAQLKNSRSFLTQLDKIIDKFDFGNKINNQLLDAKNQLKNYNKVLEKVHSKSIISDDELKDLVKAGKEIANIVTKTEKLYTNMSSSELQKFSKEYIKQVKAQEAAVAKIKNEYTNKTGKNFDKELANYDKVKSKIKELQKEKELLMKSGTTSIVTKEVEQLNAKLEEQKKKLTEIKKLQQQSSSVYNSTLESESKKRGYNSYSELKNTKVLNETQIRKQLGNAEYKQQANLISTINKQVKELENSKEDANQLDREAIKIAKQHHIQNVSSLQTLKEQLKIKREILNKYKVDKSALANEKLVTAELEKQKRLAEDKANVGNIAKRAELAVIQKGGYNSKASLTATGSAVNKSVNTLTGQLTESGIETITNNAANVVAQKLEKINGELTKLISDTNSIDETNKKLATQSERAADEQDIHAGTIQQINATNQDGNKTRKSISDVHSDIVDTLENRSNVAGKQLEQDLNNIKTISVKELTRTFPGDKQLTIEDVAVSNNLAKLEDEYNSVFDNVRRYQEMMKQSMTLEEYQIISKQSLDDLERAKKIVNEISSTIMASKGEEIQNYERQLDNMVKHNSQGLQILDEDNLPVLKKGYSFEDYARIFDKMEAAKGAYSQVSKAQSGLNETINQAIKNTHNYNQELNQHTSQTNNNTNSIKNHEKAVNKDSQALIKAAEQSQYLGSTFDDVKNKIGYFLSLNYVFDQMTRKITEAIQTTKEMDKDMTQIGLVLNKTAGQVWKNFDTYSQMAERLNTTTSQVTNSMKLFYQQGLNTSEVNKMVEASAIAAALGESTMAEASETLTSIINSYNLSANEAMMVTDKISQIAIVSAADFGELSIAIEKVASSAASAGLDLDHMMGYLGKMIETTREAPTNIGTALKTIVANFTQFKEDPTGLTEEGSDINKVDKALKSVGISLTNANGEVRDLGDVLDDLGRIWNTLNRSQRAYLATQIAGTRQQSRFYALMNDYDRTLELVAEGSNSAGKAQQQFALYSNSLEAATNRLTNQWEKFFNDITKGNGVVALFTNTLTQLMKIANTIGPIGTVLGLGETIKLARNVVTTFDSLNKTIQERKNSKEDFKITKAEISNSKLSSDEKTKKLEEETINFNRNRANSLVDLTEAQKQYIKSIEHADRVQNVYNHNIKKMPKVLQGAATTVTNLGTGMKKLGAYVKLGAAQIKTALTSMVTHFALLGAAMLAFKVASGVFDRIQTALGTNTEAYVANAEKATENADNIKELTSEYEELSKKITLTAEEQERLKEITSEVTKIDSKLGQQLKENANNYKENVKVMEEYAKLQDRIAAQETAKAISSESSMFNLQNLFMLLDFENFWPAITGTQSEKNSLTSYQQNNWRSLSNARGTAAGLTDQQMSMLSRYTEKLIQWQEDAGWESLDYKFNLDDFDNSINDFIDKLSLLNEKQIANYEQIISYQHDDTISLNKYAELLQNIDIPSEIKVTLTEDLNNLRNQIYNYIQNNPDIQNKDVAYSNALNLPQNLLKQIVGYDTTVLNSEEKSQYNLGLSQFLQNEEAIKGYTAAIQNGTEVSDDYVRTLINTNKITAVFGESLLKITEITSLIEPAKTALSSLIDYVDNSIKTGKISQTEILQGLLEDKIALSDIRINTVDESISSGNMANPMSQFMTVSMKPYLDQMNNYIKTILQPLNTKLDKQSTDIATMKAYGASYTTISAERNALQDQITQLKTKQDQAEIRLNNAMEEEKKVMNQLSYSGFTLGAGNSLLSNLSGEALYGEKNRYNVNPKKGNGFFGASMPIEMGKTNEEVFNNVIAETDEANEEFIELTSQISKLEEEYGKLGTQLTEITNKTQQNNGVAEDLDETTKEVIKSMEKEQQATQELYDSLELILKADIKPIEEFTSIFNQFAIMGEVDSQLESMQAAWDMTQESMQDYRKVASMIAEDPSLINAIDMEAEHLQFSDEALEAHAKNVLQAEMKSIDSKIKGTEAIIALLEGQTESSDAWKNATTEDISEAIAYNDSLTEQEQTSTEQEATELTKSISNWGTWSTEVQTAIQNVAKARAQMVSEINANSESSNVQVKDINGATLTGSGAENKETITKESLQSKIESLYTDSSGNVDDSKRQSLLEKYKNTKTILEKLKGSLQKDINDVGGLFDRNSSGSGGSDDTFEPVIEKLEKFYNYLRQLEELEAEINRIREKRNLIDASKNYYVQDLREENDLLREQQSIYNDYIRDQGFYLAELRSQIQSEFGDWAYFNKDGVIQVRQTEFTANSEEEEEHLNNFLDLVDLYQNEYNTREENINKLYEIENTQLENIKTLYEKILTRVQDINDELNRQVDLLDHDLTMSFENIAKYDIMDDKAIVAVEGIKTAQAYLNDFEEQVKSLNQEVKNGPFSELLLWDEALQIWRTNEEALQDESIIAKYEAMGYAWQDIDTYIRSVATKSQSIRDAWKETEDSANAFAEQLKQLIDDRISAIQDFYGASTEELNKIFDSFEEKMTDIDNQNNLFGVAAASLEEKYLTLVTAVAVLKQTIGQLNNNRQSILDKIQEEYPEYITMINGVAIANKQAIEESNKLSEEQKAELLQLYGILEASEEQIGEMEDKLVDYFNTMLEMEQAKRDAIVELKQSVHDELIARDQEEIDNLRSKYDKMSQLDSEYYSELSQRVNDSRNLRENRQQASDISQMQARLAILKADNSGTYNAELIELQKQINTALQTQADNDINMELERIQREQQQREEDRQLTISAMENVLTFKDDNNWYWQEAQRIWDEGPESVTGFLRSSREYMNISDEQRAAEFENLTNNMNTAFSTLQTEAGLSDRISDGVVIGKSDEEQLKLDNVNNNLSFIQQQLGESGLAGKIDWANSQNMLKLDTLMSTERENAQFISDKMQLLYTEKIGPGTDSVKATIVGYLGESSSIWKKLNEADLALDQTHTDINTGFTNAVNAASNAASEIVKCINAAKDEYLETDDRLYKWLNDKYAKDNADKTTVTSGSASTKAPTTSGNGNSGSSAGGKGTGSSAASQPSLAIGSTVSVKPGTRWYYDSYGTNPSGVARGGKITYTNLKGSHPYNIEGLGWIKKTDIVGYSKGGYVDYTGVANVHGTQREPEAFLNAKQTRLFEMLRDGLVRTTSKTYEKPTSTETNKQEYNIDNLSIEVKELADVDSIEKVTKRVKEEIYRDSIGHNNMAVRRR